MSYIKPVVALKTGEPCDPTQVNADVLPITQELSGHVIDHNIVAGAFPESRVANGAYYEFGGGAPYYKECTADMHIPADPLQAHPLTTDANAWRVPNSGEWTLVGAEQVDANQMSVSPGTGESVLWIIGQVQYGVAAMPYTSLPEPYAVAIGFLPLIAPVGSTTFVCAHPSLQFAIRVDGVIDEGSITGLEDTNRPAPIGYLPEDPTRKDGILGGPRPFSIHTFVTSDTESLQIPVYCVRIEAHVPVDEGDHTVELVVRRLPHVPGRDETFLAWTRAGGQTYLPADVYCYNRKFLVVDMHVQAPSTGTSFSVSTNPVDEGDIVGGPTMGTPLIDLATSMNDLGDGAIARNGLRNQHLPSRVLYPRQTGLTSGANVNVAVPAFGTIGGTWNRVQDAAANYCQVDGPFDFTVNPGFVILLGNVAVNAIVDTAAPLRDRRAYSWFTIQGVYTVGPTPFGKDSTEMAISNPNVLYATDVVNAVQDPIETDVPLFEFFDYRDAPPAGGVIANFRVLGGNAYGFGPVTPSTFWRRSNLMMIAFKK